MDHGALRERIERLAADPSGLRGPEGEAVEEVIAALDVGRLRVCEPDGDRWVTHAWVKQAILLYFRRMDVLAIGGDGMSGTASAMRADAPSYYDKLPTKRNYAELGARCVPPGVARYGSYLGNGTIMMPSYVNIGAYVDDGTMVDTWATVGSCAQIGKDVHLSGGVGIGGVLEPPQAQPVVVEDGAFVGSRCIVVEGVRVGREAVLGAGVVLTASTPIVDVRGGDDADRARLRRATQRRHPGLAAQDVRGRRVRNAVRAGHRRAHGVDRSQDVARADVARARGRRMNPRVTSLAPSAIRALHAKKRPTSIDLGLGEPTLLPNVAHFESATRWVARHGCRYSSNAGDDELRAAIAAHYAYPGLDEAANVCITTGSQEAVYVAIKTVLDPEHDELLIVEPAFPVYAKVAQIDGIPVRRVVAPGRRRVRVRRGARSSPRSDRRRA